MTPRVATTSRALLYGLGLLALPWAQCGCEDRRAAAPTPPRRTLRPDAGLLPVEVDAPDAGPSLPVLLEKEPNNWPEFAQTVTPGILIRGHIGYPLTRTLGDRDVFCFEVPSDKPQVLRAELRGVPRLTLQLSLRTARWALVHSTQAPGPGKGLVLSNLTLSPGRYCLSVSEAHGGPPYRFDKKEAYELSYRLLPERPDEEREPNDKFYGANPLEPGREIRGLLGEPGDRDWYRVSLAGLPAHSLLAVNYRGVAGVTAELTVYDYARRQIAARRGTRGASVVLRDLRVALHTGVIYVLVQGGRRFSTEERYRLRVEATAAAANREVEPNDTPVQAVALSGARGEVRGVIEVAKDVDWYLLSLPGRVNLRLHVLPPPGLDLQVTVRDLRGRRLADSDQGRAGEAEVLANVRASVGVRIQVAGARRTFDPKASYRLIWAATPSDRGDEQEPNDRVGQANALAPGISARGFIHPTKDVDWYRFRLVGFLGSTQRVRIAVQGIPGVRLALALYDDHQNELSRSALPTSEGLRVIETTLHCAKTYYVKIHDEQDRRASARDNYELLVALARR